MRHRMHFLIILPFVLNACADTVLMVQFAPALIRFCDELQFCWLRAYEELRQIHGVLMKSCTCVMTI